MRRQGSGNHNPNRELPRRYVDRWHNVFGVEYQPDPIPERNLLAAVIRRALLDITVCPPSEWSSDWRGDNWFDRLLHPETSARNAVAWIENMGMDPWGYAWACQELDLPTLTVVEILNMKVSGNELRGFARTTSMSQSNLKTRKQLKKNTARELVNG